MKIFITKPFCYTWLAVVCSLLFFNSSKAQMGNALNFDGTDDYVSVPGGSGLNNLQTEISSIFYANLSLTKS